MSNHTNESQILDATVESEIEAFLDAEAANPVDMIPNKNRNRAKRRHFDKVAVSRQVDIGLQTRSGSLGSAEGSLQRGRFRKNRVNGSPTSGSSLTPNARRNQHISGLCKLTKQEQIAHLAMKSEMADALQESQD